MYWVSYTFYITCIGYWTFSLHIKNVIRIQNWVIKMFWLGILLETALAMLKLMSVAFSTESCLSQHWWPAIFCSKLQYYSHRINNNNSWNNCIVYMLLPININDRFFSISEIFKAMLKETGFLHVCIPLLILNLNAENLCLNYVQNCVQWIFCCVCQMW